MRVCILVLCVVLLAGTCTRGARQDPNVCPDYNKDRHIKEDKEFDVLEGGKLGSAGVDAAKQRAATAKDNAKKGKQAPPCTDAEPSPDDPLPVDRWAVIQTNSCGKCHPQCLCQIMRAEMARQLRQTTPLDCWALMVSNKCVPFDKGTDDEKEAKGKFLCDAECEKVMEKLVDERMSCLNLDVFPGSSCSPADIPKLP